jgi:hypothetical protein
MLAAGGGLGASGSALSRAASTGTAGIKAGGARGVVVFILGCKGLIDKGGAGVGVKAAEK